MNPRQQLGEFRLKLVKEMHVHEIFVEYFFVSDLHAKLPAELVQTIEVTVVLIVMLPHLAGKEEIHLLRLVNAANAKHWSVAEIAHRVVSADRTEKHGFFGMAHLGKLLSHVLLQKNSIRRGEPMFFDREKSEKNERFAHFYS